MQKKQALRASLAVLKEAVQQEQLSVLLVITEVAVQEIEICRHRQGVRVEGWGAPRRVLALTVFCHVRAETGRTTAYSLPSAAEGLLVSAALCGV